MTATVTAIGVERSRRAHPSSQTAPDLTPQLLASLVARWRDGAPVNPTDANRVIDHLLANT